MSSRPYSRYVSHVEVSERGRVGAAMDTLRDALAPYVDDAMRNAHGADWNNVVSEENARYRKSSRRYPVAKNDLAVLLQQLLRRRIEPWQSRDAYPQVKAYASEILSLRNIHSHGGECVGEYERLLDTGRRLLVALDLSVPESLMPELPPAVESAHALVAAAGRAPAELDPLDDDLAELGPTGVALLAIFSRTGELSNLLTSVFNAALQSLDLERPDSGAFREQFVSGAERVGGEVVDQLAKTYELEAGRGDAVNADLDLLTFAVRCELLNPQLGGAAKLHVLELEREFDRVASKGVEAISNREGDAAPDLSGFGKLVGDLRERIDGIEKMLAFGQSDSMRWRSLIQLADGLRDDHPFANMLVASASLHLVDALRDADEDDGWHSEALPVVRSAVSRLRFEAATKPGSDVESLLVHALRLEGGLCNDLGLADEAIKAFARADEIVDRYPTADPSIRS